MLGLTVEQIGQLAFIVFFFVSAFLVIHALLTLITQSGQLKLRLTELGAELESVRPSLPDKRRRVDGLRRHLPGLKRERQQMADYYAKLTSTLRQHEEQLAAQQQETQQAGDEAADRRSQGREITRHHSEWDDWSQQ